MLILDDMARNSHDAATVAGAGDRATVRTPETRDGFHPDRFPIAVERGGSQREGGAQARESSRVVIITGGHGLCVGGEEPLPLGAGDVLVLGGDRLHAYRGIDSLRLVSVLFDPGRLLMDPKDLPDLAGYRVLFAPEAAWPRRPHLGGRLRLSPKDLGIAVGIVDRLEHELRARDAGFGFLSAALFMQLIGHLSRCYGRSRPSAPRSRSRIAEAVAHLETRYDSEIDLDQLAAIAHMSKRNFLRAFRAAFGKSPIAYLIELRVGRAAALLRRGDANVTEVAFRVGFNDSNYFSRQFHKVIGVSPSVYQRQQA